MQKGRGNEEKNAEKKREWRKGCRKEEGMKKRMEEGRGAKGKNAERKRR